MQARGPNPVGARRVGARRVGARRVGGPKGGGPEGWGARRVGGPKGGGPEGWGARRVGGPKGGGPEGWGARRVGGLKFRAFFPLPPQNSFFSSLSGGLLVEFWWCLKRRGAQMCTFGVLWLSCEAPAQQTRFGQSRFWPKSVWPTSVWPKSAMTASGGYRSNRRVCRPQDCIHASLTSGPRPVIC